MLRLEAFADDVVEKQQDITGIPLKHVIHNLKIIVIVENVEILDDRLIGNLFSGETDHLVEDRQSVTKGSIRLLGDDV